jgi:protein SCO1
MKRLILPIAIIAAIGLALSIAGMLRIVHRIYNPYPTPLVADASLADLVVPPFRLIDQDGRPVDEHILEGRVTILDFVFTNCPYACPMMTGAMSDLCKRLEHVPVRLMSISVDPQHDTPQKLLEYAEKNKADLSRWSFLTTDPGGFETIQAIVRGSLKMALEQDQKRTVTLPDGTVMPNVVHPTKLILVGPDRHVIGLYESTIPEDVQALEKRVKSVARGVSK